MAYTHGDTKKLASSKAKKMLKDGTANGKPLTEKQKGYFGVIAGGGKPRSGNPQKKGKTDGAGGEVLGEAAVGASKKPFGGKQAAAFAKKGGPKRRSS